MNARQTPEETSDRSMTAKRPVRPPTPSDTPTANFEPTVASGPSAPTRRSLAGRGRTAHRTRCADWKSSRTGLVSRVVSTSIRLLAASALTLGAFGSAPAEAAQFRLASLAPQESQWGQLLQEMAAEIKKETKGAVRFKLFLGGKLGDESKVTKKLGRGLDGAFFTGRGLGGLLPGLRVLELPFLIESYEEADAVRAALWPEFEKAFEQKTDFVLVGPGETGMVYLFGKTPVADVAGLRQARLWVWEGDRVASDTFKVFGVSPRPLDILTVVQQLKSGGIDTVYNSPSGAVALGWTGDLRFISGRSFAYASGGLAMTKKAWNKIPSEHRQTVRRIAKAYGERIITRAREDNAAARARLIAAGGGLKQVPISDAKYDEFRAVAQAAWTELAKNLNATEYLAQARKTLGK